jgi:4-amino-4-deoxy-L-arabinose transferase-like glycosyltransferase
MESQRFRHILLALAAVLAAGFFLATRGYWVPADPGVDENAYLVSGKLLAQTGSPGFVPPDPYSLVGKMWIGTREGRFYPKYPLGQTLLVALAVKTTGPRAAYWISPLLMTLALLGIFLLGREIAGSFAGLLAMTAMAASPATLNEVNDPDSHASSLGCTTWGMLLLLRWWRTGKVHHAALAGLLLGYSTIIRYTEGLLLLPIALVVLFRCGRRPDRRALGGAAALAAGWLAPVAGQVLFNLHALHSLTGYDTTHESTAFSLAYFVHNALPTARLLATLGLPVLLPWGALGLTALALREGRPAAVLWAWLLPNLLLYTAYYWGLQTEAVNCLRFFLTILPPLALGAAWLLTLTWHDRPLRWPQAAVVLALFLTSAGLGVRLALPLFWDDWQEALDMERGGKAVLAFAPPGSAVLGPQNEILHLQFVGNYRLYSRNLFVRSFIAELRKVDGRSPDALQPERAQALFSLLRGRDKLELARLERGLMAAQIHQGRRVFLIAPVQSQHWTEFASPGLNASDGLRFATRRLALWRGPGEERPDGEREPGGADWQLLEVTAAPRGEPSSPAP